MTRIDEKEKIQGKIIKKILDKLPKSISAIGNLMEIGIESRVSSEIPTADALSLHNSEEERLGRQIVVVQREEEYFGWAKETERIAGRVGVGRNRKQCMRKEDKLEKGKKDTQMEKQSKKWKQERRGIRKTRILGI